MARKIIGIDLGSYSVKVAELDRGLKSFSLVGFYEKQVQNSDLLSHEESLAIALQSIIDDYNLTWDSCVVGFPAEKLATRILSFPFSGGKKLAQAIPFELETFVPFDIEEIVWDHSIVKQSKEFSKVVVSYAQKKDIGKLITTLDGINVSPRKICAEGIELSHLMNLGLVPPEGGYAIVDIGHKKTVITVCHGTEFGHSRSILIAGDAITQAIAKKLSVPKDEAERLKIELGQVPMSGDEELDDTTKAVTEAIKSVLEELVVHLRQTLFAYRETEDVPPQGIYLCGGTSRLVGLDRYLSDVLKLNVTYLDCSEMQFSNLDRSAGHRHVIPGALSLALRGVAGGGVSIDFRKGEFLYRGDVEQVGGGVKKFGIIAVILVILALSVFGWRYYSLKAKLEAVNNEIADITKQIIPDAPPRVLTSPNNILSYIKGRQAEMETRAKTMESMLAMSPLDILKEISKAVPSRDQITIDAEAINITPPRIVIRGSTDSFESVDKIKQSLEASMLFSQVSTGNVRKGVKDEVKFDLSMELKGSEKETEEIKK